MANHPTKGAPMGRLLFFLPTADAYRVRTVFTQDHTPATCLPQGYSAKESSCYNRLTRYASDGGGRAEICHQFPSAAIFIRIPPFILFLALCHYA
jgi:hypothetical protein